MKLSAGHKTALFLAVIITAAVLCTLPFFLIKKEVIYIYTENRLPTSEENGFIRELRRSGLEVIVNSSSMPDSQSYGFWFKSPEYVPNIRQSEAKLNFLYTDAYYPADWKNTDKHPIILTPYRLLFEHYMRSNIKSALMVKGINLADYYPETTAKKYAILYYGDNNQNSPVAEELQKREDTYFLGAYWEKRNKTIEPNEEKNITTNTILSQSKIIVIYHQPDSALSKRVPEDIMQAASVGALVFSSPNQSVEKTYKDNVIIYDGTEDLKQKLDYYLKNYNKIQDKILTAQKITLENFSSQAMSKRFNELLHWLKQKQKN